MKPYLGAVVLLALCGCGAPSPDPALDGTWELSEFVADGVEGPQRKTERAVLTIRGDTYSVDSGNQIVHRGTFKVVGTTPKGIDLVVTTGTNKGETRLGIYEVEGDTLLICFRIEGNSRPGELTALAKSDRRLETWRRVR